jgi:hypothetical protein
MCTAEGSCGWVCADLRDRIFARMEGGRDIFAKGRVFGCFCTQAAGWHGCTTARRFRQLHHNVATVQYVFNHHWTSE